MAEFQEGKVTFSRTPHASYSTYYKTYGDLRNGTPPLIVLHEGPGFQHEYMLPHKDLWILYGISVVFYDQIGGGRSTRLPHTRGDTSFWNVELFIKELENLLDHLQLNRAGGAGYDILGHSWGGMLGLYFASTHPSGLRRLILTGTAADSEACYQGYWEFIKKHLSAEEVEAIREAVEKHEFTSPEYQAANMEFYKKVLCRADPWPEVLGKGIAEMAADNTVYRTFQGESLFARDGQIIKWSSIPYLHRINVPTLVMNGEFDTLRYEDSAPYLNLIPKVRLVTLAGGSHSPFLDSKDLLDQSLELVGNFLRPEQALHKA